MATWAKGLDFKNNNNTKIIGGIGVYGNDGNTEKVYLGLGATPWDNKGLEFTTSAIKFNGTNLSLASHSHNEFSPSSHTHTTVGAYIGVSNTINNNGHGISLYGGATNGQPSYGLMFQGTATFGKHGAVQGDLATYFTMAGSSNRGWIFKYGTGTAGNVASISSNGVITGSEFKIGSSSNARFGYEAASKDTYISNNTDNWLRLKENRTLLYAGSNVQISSWGTGNPSNGDDRPDGAVYYRY